MPNNHNDDPVLIIGAGAAGLSAARELARQGIDFRIIEASHRVGGRAYSEAYQTGGWFDLGCSYLHEGEINPLVPIAQGMGFDLGNGDRFSIDNWMMKHTGSGISADLLKEYTAFDNDLENRMAEFARQNSQDAAIADLMDWDNPFASTHAHLLAGLNASDASDQSVVDHLKAGSGKDYPVNGGLGRVVEALAGGMPVELNCTAEKISWGNQGVSVETNKGVIKASKVIITVSTGIMNSGRVEFTPALPDAYLEAFSLLKCGTLNKIGVALDGDALRGDKIADITDGWYVNFPGPHDHQSRDEDIASVDIIISDRPQAVVFAGGSFGEYLEKQGRAAMIDYAETCLINLFGSSIRAHIEDHITTAWMNDPLTLGAYSYATPGGSPARQFLATPVDELIYFAGEAISIQHYGTCHGAYISGMETARAISQS